MVWTLISSLLASGAVGKIISKLLDLGVLLLERSNEKAKTAKERHKERMEMQKNEAYVKRDYDGITGGWRKLLRKKGGVPRIPGQRENRRSSDKPR